MTENKYVGWLVYALTAAALAVIFYISATVKGVSGSAGISQEYEMKLFDKASVMTVDIIMPDEKWQEFLDNAVKEEYYDCDVVINGETFYNVGIRAKGNTSLTNIAEDEDTDRYSFKIKFDEYVSKQTCYGLDKLVLNNNYADATNMKEALIYDMFEYLDADASLYNYSKISVNGKYIGVYLALEGVEDSFLRRNYGTKSGNLYKPENMGFQDAPSDKRMPEDFPKGGPEGFPENGKMPEDFPEGGPGGGPGGMGSEGGSNLNYTDDDPDSYSTIWEGEIGNTSKADHQRVIEALRAISEGDASSAEKYMDVDNLLKYMAVHEFAVNNDSLSGNMAHNYYLYESGGKLNIIPWDYNLSWGGMGSKDSGDASSIINDPVDDSWGCTDFFDILLENEEYRSRYHEYLEMLVDYVENGQYDALMKRLHEQTDNLVASDPTAFYTYEEYAAAADVLDKVIRLRAESIKGQVEGVIPSTSEGQREDGSHLIDAAGIDTSVMGTMKAGKSEPGGSEGFFKRRKYYD
ncbi:MAG: CotH kinase family protein [Lachnospiraceae bacterium]|nr:CotH kinase family protein [Lachnospiraceae bacterium]